METKVKNELDLDELVVFLLDIEDTNSTKY
jgi:hypothetical protein